MRYFFHLAGAVHGPDAEGQDLASLSDARIAAVKFAAGFLNDRPDVVWLGDELRIEVTNADGLNLFTVIVFGVDSPSIRKQRKRQSQGKRFPPPMARASSPLTEFSLVSATCRACRGKSTLIMKTV